MISNKFIFDKANAKIATGDLSALEITQLSSIDASLAGSVSTVDTFVNLPNAEDNTGRLVYVTELGKYYFSNGDEWSDNYSTELTNLSSSYGWGSNGFFDFFSFTIVGGFLGDGTTTSRSSPVSAVGDINNWTQVSAGAQHSLGVTADGIAYAWGINTGAYFSYIGALGDGTLTNRSSPVSVIGGITNWAQVSAGGAHSLGVTASGIAYAWGQDTYGQLGTGGYGTIRSSPVTVVGGITNWAQVSAGRDHSLGLTADGIAYGWGRNVNGQLGDGTTYSSSSPVTVIGGITNWAQVSAGRNHSLGVTADGIAYAWGYGGKGYLGDGTSYISRPSPVSVIGGITNWAQVSANTAHSLGVTASGIAYGWGSNGYIGRLGDGTSGYGTNRSSPVSVIGGITNWAQVSAGLNHSLGVTADGIAYAWGQGFGGRLGNGTTTDCSSPVSVIGGFTTWAQVSAGNTHSLGVVATAEFGFTEPGA
jgi:alpha-tubulin suppressor-like RCC1 family protein